MAVAHNSADLDRRYLAPGSVAGGSRAADGRIDDADVDAIGIDLAHGFEQAPHPRTDLLQVGWHLATGADEEGEVQVVIEIAQVADGRRCQRADVAGGKV